MKELTQVFQQACEAQQRGELQRAEQLYNSILAHDPGHESTLYNLGIIKYSTAQYGQAKELFSRAIARHSTHAGYYFSLALSQVKLGETDQAVASYETSVKLAPDYLAAWNNLGHLYLEINNYESAARCFRQVLRLDPQNLSAWQNLGAIQIALRQYDEAIGSLERADSMRPGDPVTLQHLGNVYFKKKDLVPALRYLRSAIEKNPDLHNVRSLLAETMMLLADYDGAESELEKLLGLSPEVEKITLGLLARLYEFKGDLTRAADYNRRVMALDPDFYPARKNYLYTISYFAMLSPEQTLQAHLEWNRQIHCDEKRRTYHWPRPRDRQTDAGRKLKIGYLSADFRQHPVGTLFNSLLRHHDRERFDIFCYASVVNPDDMTRRLREHATHWVAVEGLEDAALADRVHRDEIDILVDLGGHTGETRLPAMAYRPAPVQASYMGYCTTTGLATMDYWITDEILHPQDTVELAVERIIRLPRCWITYQPPPAEITPEVNERPHGPVCFGSFNQVSKLSSEVISAWADILNSVDQSRLLLKCFQLLDKGVRREITRHFVQRGIAAERIVLQGHDSQYMAAYHGVDIALDPFPRTGCLTTLDALWMGVPVITLSGKRFIERQGRSILQAIGHPEWVADSSRDYIDKAVSSATVKRSAAGQSRLRSSLRRSLRGELQRSPLLDGASLAAALEVAYRSMWQTYLEQSGSGDSARTEAEGLPKGAP